MILITGASGSVGKAVLHEAIRKESKVRAMFRSKEDAAEAPSGCESVLADFSDKQSLRKAMKGVTSVTPRGFTVFRSQNLISARCIRAWERAAARESLPHTGHPSSGGARA
jgi:uncharacterized protein YbjT (DUF2867 family)